MSVNYSSIVSINAPQNSRTVTNIYPASGTSFNSVNGQSVISFAIPATAYLDPTASFLKFNAQITATPLALNAAGQSAICLDNNANSFFNRAQLFTGDSGVLISEQQNHHFIAKHILKSYGQTYCDGIGKQAMGYHEAFDADDLTNTTTNLGNAIYNASINTPKFAAALGTLGAGSVQGIPGAAVLAINSAANTPVLGEVVEYAIPLSFFSGLFANSKNLLLPMKYMGKSNALRLDLTLNTPQYALVATAAVAGAATFWDTASNGTISYNLTNVELITSVVNMGSELDESVRDMVYSPESDGVSIQYPQYTSMLSSGWAASTEQFQMIMTKYALSLEHVMIELRDASKLGLFSYASVSGSRRFGLNQIQVAIGPRLSTNKPLRLDSPNYNGAAYLQLTQCANRGNTLVSTDNFYQIGQLNDKLSGFSVGFNWGSRTMSSATADAKAVFDAVDTRSGSSTVQVVAYRDTGTPGWNTSDYAIPLAMLLIIETLAPLLITPAGVIPTKD